MICGSHYNSVNIITHFIKHLPPVPEFFCIRKMLERFFGIAPVHITKCYDIFRFFDLPDYTKTAPSHSNTGHIQFITWHLLAHTAHYRAWHNCKSRGSGSSFSKKIFSGDRILNT